MITECSSPIEPREIEKNVIANAERFGHDVKRLNVLHTPDLKDISGSYKVDIEKKTLVKVTDPPIRFKNL